MAKQSMYSIFLIPFIASTILFVSIYQHLDITLNVGLFLTSFFFLIALMIVIYKWKQKDWKATEEEIRELLGDNNEYISEIDFINGNPSLNFDYTKKYNDYKLEWISLDLSKRFNKEDEIHRIKLYHELGHLEQLKSKDWYWKMLYKVLPYASVKLIFIVLLLIFGILNGLKSWITTMIDIVNFQNSWLVTTLRVILTILIPLILAIWYIDVKVEWNAYERLQEKVDNKKKLRIIQIIGVSSYITFYLFCLLFIGYIFKVVL